MLANPMTKLLWVVLVLPAAAAALVAVLGPRRAPAIRWISLGTTLVCAVLAFVLAVGLGRHLAPIPGGSVTPVVDGQVPTFQPEYETRIPFLPLGTGAIEFYIGL